MNHQIVALFQRINKAIAKVEGIKVTKWHTDYLEIVWMNKKFYLILCGGYEGLLSQVRKIRRDDRKKKTKDRKVN